MNDKPKMLYASPFPPLRSGISDYSVCLVEALSEYFEITLYSDNYEIEDEYLSQFQVLKNGVDYIDFDSYKYKIYNIGNQPDYHWFIYEAAIEHPGMIILHDYMLYYLFVGLHQKKKDVYSSLYTRMGLEDFLTVKNAVKKSNTSLLKQKELASVLPLNKELLLSGNKVMVHSEYSRNKILATGCASEENVKKINLLSLIEKDYEKALIDKENLYSKFGVPKDALLIASFGYIAETKRNKEICEAIKTLSAQTEKKICYVMVGEGDYVDDELEEGLIIKTGYTEIDEFNSFIVYADIIVNLRYPSMGETSSTMLRIMQLGKACITNDGGWFTEIPDDCVIKIDVLNAKEEVENTVKSMIEDDNLRESIGRKAGEYVDNEFNGEVVAKQIKEFIE